MDLRALTPTYAVSPQIQPQDLPLLKAAGYVTVIDNRPDGEIPPQLHTAVMRAAAEALGLTFVSNPVIGGALTMDNVLSQRAAIEASPGPVFAYCASGNRSSVVWALANAGKLPADQMIDAAARYGYNLDHLRPQIAALAATTRVFAVDMPGHGRSSPLPQGASLPDYVDWAARVITALGVGTVNVAGHSDRKSVV